MVIILIYDLFPNTSINSFSIYFTFICLRKPFHLVLIFSFYQIKQLSVCCGSGKSNILDAICFVLGLSGLDIARCQNLLDLVYKSGKAGILSVKVTIELDDSKKIFHKPDWRHFEVINVSRTVSFFFIINVMICV